jgi:50S ribosomal protein L16 3-hydroxylase
MIIGEDDRWKDWEIPIIATDVSAEAIARLHGMVAERLLDRDAFASWFGQYSSTPKNAEIDWRPEDPLKIEDVRARVGNETPLLRNAASRCSFIRQPEDGVMLFVDGHGFACAGEAASFAEQLCAHDRVVIDPALAASDETIELIMQLLNQGSLAFEPEI